MNFGRRCLSGKEPPPTTRSNIDSKSIAQDRLNPVSMFNSPFTPREEELQKLLAEERQRSEQRRTNYNTLKSEHLKLQNEYLHLQAEIKQILEETVYVKEKKNNEVEELLKVIEEKTKQIQKLEKTLRDNDPDIIKLKLAEEMEEPLRKLRKNNEYCEKDKERALNELKLVRQQLEHLEKEHLDSIEKVKLSYEAELNLIKREKEEIRTRLIEASQSHDVKRLIELSEDNSRLNSKLQSSQTIIEQAEKQYNEIHKKVENLILEHDKKEQMNENQIKNLNDQIQTQKDENKKLKNELAFKKSENEELLSEIGRLKMFQEKLKYDMSQQSIRFNEEKEDILLKKNQEVRLVVQEKNSFYEEIKKLEKQIDDKMSTIQSLEKAVNLKNIELTKQMESARKHEIDRIAKLEQEKKSLETDLNSIQNEKRDLRVEIDKLRKQIAQQNEAKLVHERETMLLRTKVDTQSVTIEELEKIRRQHVLLHEETNRMRSEMHDLICSNKELSRINQNYKEEYGRLKEQLEEERRNLDEIKLSNEKTISKISRRFEEERVELFEKIGNLERRYVKHKDGNNYEMNGCRLKSGEYSRLKAKQYAKLADRLNSVLDQLKNDDSQRKANQYSMENDRVQKVKSNNLNDERRNVSIDNVRPSNNGTLETHNQLKRELQKVKRKQLELEACLHLGHCSLASNQSSPNKVN